MDPVISRKIPEIASEASKDNPRAHWDARKTPKAHHRTQNDPPKVLKRIPKNPKGRPNIPKNFHMAPKTTPSRNQENGHRASDSTDTALKQHCVNKKIGPAECAERLNLSQHGTGSALN